MGLFQDPPRAMRGGEFAGRGFPAIRDVITGFGLAAFGQT